MVAFAVKILVCDSCQREAEKTNHLDLYSTYRSIIFGCQHSIEQLKKDVDEQVKLAREMAERWASLGTTTKVIKHSKVEFKQGRFLIKGDKPVTRGEDSGISRRDERT